jgi:hypothetical protein
MPAKGESMSTVVLSIGVIPQNGKAKVTNLSTIELGKKGYMIPIVFPTGKNLEAKRKETHRLIDECIDAFEKAQGK